MPRNDAVDATFHGETLPFFDVANRKGLTLLIGPPATVEEFALWCIDMDLVLASLHNALARAKTTGVDTLVHRIEQLIDNGTPVQHVDFVTGDRRTYYFPEDIERMVVAGRDAAFPYFTHSFAWLRCQPIGAGVHRIEERHKQIRLIQEAL